MARYSLSAVLGVIAIFLQTALALKFDLQAHPGHSVKNERCIRNFVNRDTLVVVTATVGGYKGDGMLVNMHVSPRCRVPTAATTARQTRRASARAEVLFEQGGNVSGKNTALTRLLKCRSRMQSATTTAAPKTSSARSAWLSPV
jgi:hypothetical protein